MVARQARRARRAVGSQLGRDVGGVARSPARAATRDTGRRRTPRSPRRASALAGHARRSPRSPRSRATVRSAAMDEDADRALRPLEDAGDLRRRHLVTKRRTRPAAGRRTADRRARQAAPPPRGRPRSPRRRAGRRVAIARIERRLGSAAASRRRSFGDDVAGDPEQPDPERRGALAVLRRARSWNRGRPQARTGTSVRWRPPPRGGRRARRPRSCTPGPRTSDRGRRTAPGRPAPPPRAADRGRGGRGAGATGPSGRDHLPQCRSGHRVTPRRGGGEPRGEPDVADLADEDARLRRRVAVLDQERARVRCRRRVPGPGRARRPGATRSTARPVVTWRSLQPARRTARARSASTRGLQPVEEGASSAAWSIGAAAASSRSDVIESARSGGKAPRGQSPFTPMPMTARGSSVPRPSVSPSTPASLLSPPGPRRRGRSATSARSSPTAAGRPPRAASAIASDAIAASRQTLIRAQPGRAEPER